jgi:hypothetical protein
MMNPDNIEIIRTQEVFGRLSRLPDDVQLRAVKNLAAGHRAAWDRDASNAEGGSVWDLGGGMFAYACHVPAQIMETVE